MSEITPFENNTQALIEFYRGNTIYRIAEKQEGSGVQLAGEYRKRLVIVLPQPLSSYDNATVEMLGKMLAAQGLVMEDIGFAVWTPQNSWTSQDLIHAHTPSAILFYGVNPIKLGLSLSLYDFYHEGNVKMLYADGLDKLTGDNSLKAKLWNVLKQHFMYR